MRYSTATEVDLEWRKSDHSFKTRVRTEVHVDLRAVLVRQLCLFINFDAPNNRPAVSLIVSFFPRWTVMSQRDLLILSLLLVNLYTSRPRLMKGNGQGETFGVAICIDRLEYNAADLAVLER